MAKKADEKTATPAEPKEKGRPEYVWTEETEDAILEELMQGKVPAQILGANRRESWPGLSTFYKRIQNDASFAKKYTRAMEVRTEADVDQIREIVMAPAAEISTEYGSHVDSGDVALRRLQVDALKWTASKRLPKKYGEKLELAGDASAPLQIVVKQYTPPDV